MGYKNLQGASCMPLFVGIPSDSQPGSTYILPFPPTPACDRGVMRKGLTGAMRRVRRPRGPPARTFWPAISLRRMDDDASPCDPAVDRRRGHARGPGASRGIVGAGLRLERDRIMRRGA